MNFDESFVTQRLRASAHTISALTEHAHHITHAADLLHTSRTNHAKIITCGNGGSAAEALHLAEELLGKYNQPRDPIPAVCLAADPTALTCIANDFGFDAVFQRQLTALAKPHDTLVALSTSGNSPNIVNALHAARRLGVATVGLLGRDGGQALPLCDVPIVVPSNDTAHIQEAHLTIIHLLLEALESA